MSKAAHFLRPSQSNRSALVLMEVVLYQPFACLFQTFLKKREKGLDRWSVSCIFHGPLVWRAALKEGCSLEAGSLRNPVFFI